MTGGSRLGKLLGLTGTVCVLASSLATASETKIWTSDSASEFSAGEARGVAVTMDGWLTLSRDSHRVEGIAEAAIYAGARGKDGFVYLATGEAGKVLRVSPQGELSTYATLPEKEVTALAVGPDGAVYAGTAPGAKIYRIDANGKFAPYYQPKAQYVWALTFSGPVLYVGTGLPGEIDRVTSSNHGERVHATPDGHVRTLYVDKEGRLWAGTSGRGLVLRVEKSGAVRTLYDSSKTEITSIAASADGRVWVSASSADVAPSGNEPISAPGGPASTAKASQTIAAKGDDEAKNKPEVTVSVSSPRLAPSKPGGKQGGYSSEVLLFDREDLPRTVWSSGEEIVFALQPGAEKGTILAATGPNGKLYRIGTDGWSLERTFDEKQVTVLAGDDVGTNSASAVYRFNDGPHTGEYVSAVKDTGRTSRFGAFRWEGERPAGTQVAFSFRSGESSTPDSTWSSWSPFEGSSAGTVGAPAGRFVQWKAKMSTDGSQTPVVRRVELAYRNRNATPMIDSFLAMGPAEVFARSASGGANVFETTSPDEKGIFTSLEEPKNESPPRRLLRKRYRTLTWKASDPDGDTLTYELEFRPSDSQRWLPLRKDLREPFYSFDTTALPDGDYVFRLTASDAESNPDDAKSCQRQTAPVRIDNTPPVIRRIGGSSGTVEFEAVDAGSPIENAEYSIDAKEWIHVEPKDGLSDSPRESYIIHVDPKLHGGFLLIRVTDASRNVASASFTIP